MAKISINPGELGIVDGTEVELKFDISKTEITVAHQDEKALLRFLLTFEIRATGGLEDKIIIGKSDTSVEAESVGIFRFDTENHFSSGSFTETLDNLILVTGSSRGEVRFISTNEKVEMLTNAEKREHGTDHVLED